MSQHTPGPWHVDKDGSIRAESGDEVFASHGDGEGHYLAATSEDRRLIAAAPDLLMACEMWLSGETTWSTAQAYEMAAHAVAKARGEKP